MRPKPLGCFASDHDRHRVKSVDGLHADSEWEANYLAAN